MGKKWSLLYQCPLLGTFGKSNFILKEDLVGLPNALFTCSCINDFEHNSCQVKGHLLGSPTQSRFKSIVASSTSARRPCCQALKLGSQSLFSQSLKFMLESDLGVGSKIFQNDFPSQHNPPEMCQEMLGTMSWGVTDQDIGNRKELYSRNRACDPASLW